MKENEKKTTAEKNVENVKLPKNCCERLSTCKWCNKAIHYDYDEFYCLTKKKVIY